MTNEKKVTPVHYIDKNEFSEEMHTHASACRAARENGLPLPRCTESIGKKFLLIAKNIGNKGNFFNYTYKEEMVSDAVENMIRYRYNYDKAKGDAFSYFTQYAIYAFIARIKSEKKEQTKKMRYMQKIATHEISSHVLNDNDLDTEFKNQYAEFLVDYADTHLSNDEK